MYIGGIFTMEVRKQGPFISWQLADDFMTAVFEKIGSSNRGCETCSDVLLEVTDVN